MTAFKNPKVGVVLLNWNNYHYTGVCLESLNKCTYDNLEVIIVDNGSSDNGPERVEKDFPSAVLVRNKENLGFAEGNNVGIRRALENECDFVMLLNNDTIVEPNFVEPLVEHMTSDNSTAAIQPLIYYEHDRELIWNAGGDFIEPWGYTQTRLFRKRITTSGLSIDELDWITGCCFMVRSDAIKKVGLLNSKFFIYYEDVDWSFRLRKMGSLIIEPNSVIYHVAGGSAREANSNSASPRLHYLNIRNHIWLIKPTHIWNGIPATIIISVV